MATKDDRKRLGKFIKMRRIELDMNQQELAQAAGMTQAGISLVERGVRSITAENLVAIANALQCPAQTLCDYLDGKPHYNAA